MKDSVDLGSVDYHFVVITPRSTQTPSLNGPGSNYNKVVWVPVKIPSIGQIDLYSIGILDAIDYLY